jgi:hypothetical protein
MSLRVLGCLVLILIVIALRPPLTPAAGQSAQNATQAASEPVWEYRVVNLDSFRCTNEEAMTATLNANGRQGWELVGYQAGPVEFPDSVDGSILMRPAATGAGKDVTPQLADSFQGTIKLSMQQRRQTSACRLMFKREAGPPHP